MVTSEVSAVLVVPMMLLSVVQMKLKSLCCCGCGWLLRQRMNGVEEERTWVFSA